MERKKRAIILTILLAIFIATTMYLLFSNNTVAGKGKIINKPTMIGATQISKDVTEWWFSFPVDINGDGEKDLIVLDKAQHSNFATNMKIGWTVTYKKRNGLVMGRWLPFLWESVLDPKLPADQPQNIYLAINYR